MRLGEKKTRRRNSLGKLGGGISHETTEQRDEREGEKVVKEENGVERVYKRQCKKETVWKIWAGDE